MDAFTVKHQNLTREASDPRLGRNVTHDSRSLLFQVRPASSFAAIRTVLHTCHIPILNQGQIGSCVPNTGTEVIASDDLWETGGQVAGLSVSDAEVDEDFAVELYHDVTLNDPYEGTFPPEDTGSDGLSCAKVLKRRGLISGYTHATSLLGALTALQTRSVMTGTVWRGDMYNPDSDGRLHVTGSDEGAHEYTLFGVDAEYRRVFMRNHWDEWGIGVPGYAETGCAYLTWDDFEELLHQEGDVTNLIPANQPAPVPVPPDPVESFVAQAEYWVGLRHVSKANTTFERQVQTYLDYLKKGHE